MAPCPLCGEPGGFHTPECSHLPGVPADWDLRGAVGQTDLITAVYESPGRLHYLHYLTNLKDPNGVPLPWPAWAAFAMTGKESR